ncbi:DUF6118 family protein (plasmid) [Acetobacter sp. AC2005]|uniref:DUF6118 family protein n=1 Tax=Acetobacter sp. AC2005 TaxID=3134142 RepID=UPI0030D1A187
MASFIVGGQDRWESAIAMMKDARPKQWSGFMWEDQLMQDNHSKIQDCQIAATQAGHPKSCVITVKPDAQ